ncbi:MAG TPA: hypothetical protein VMW10_01340 [Alphaproteobacteria bacterium]|nr:hypothetical protein [Alphaproteobacteria bacterium]
MRKYFFFLLILSVTGCGSVTSEKVRCPKTSILAEFSKSIDFHKEIPIRSDLDSVIPQCTTDGLQTWVDFRLRITSIRPLLSFNTPMTIKTSYFVAVIDKAGNVLSRSNHDLVVKFEEKQTTKVNFVQLEERVPLGKEASIYIGFNLDETQRDFLGKERNKNVHNLRP